MQHGVFPEDELHLWNPVGIERLLAYNSKWEWTQNSQSLWVIMGWLFSVQSQHQG